MAELLMWGVAAPPANALQYQRGDVVVIAEDGHTWSATESLPVNSGGMFWLVKIPSETVASVRSYLATGAVVGGRISKRRASGVDTSLLSGGAIALLNAGPMTFTKQQVDAVMKPR